MTLSEFKAWFEGFTEDMERPPSAKQWKRIKERIGEITGVAVTYPVYIDRYVRPYPIWSPSLAPYCGGFSTTSMTAEAPMDSLNGASFDSHSAMLSLGKTEYASVS